MSNTEEIWKDITNYEGLYQISNLGRVKSFRRRYINKDGKYVKGKGKLIKPHYNKSIGYLAIKLFKNKIRVGFYIHRLVVGQFVPNPLNKLFVNHINGIKTDNRVENLEWATPTENNAHAIRTGLNKTTGESNGMSKLNTKQVLFIRDSFSKGVTINQLTSEIENISKTAIWEIVKRKTWKHI